MNLIRDFKLAMFHRVGQTRRRILGHYVEAFLIKTDAGRFLVDAEDMAVGRSLARRGSYGREELRTLAAVLREDSALLVVGSHLGALAIPASKLCRQVTAIEANPRTFELLRMNILLNECGNVTPINIAANDTAGAIPFVMSRTNSGGSKRLPVKRDSMYFYDSPDVVNVAAKPLDEALAGQRFDVILMDVEGSEYFALRGMPTLLSAAETLIMEFVPHHLRNVSGVSVSNLVSTLAPYFPAAFLPSKNLHLDRSEFITTLQQMYDRDETDEGILFSKQ